MKKGSIALSRIVPPQSSYSIRTTEQGSILGPKAVKLENTYRMEPRETFQTGAVVALIDEVLKSNLDEMDYDPLKCAELCAIISDDIKEKVKALEMPRFKIVCVTNIGKKNEQGLRVTSRCLWNPAFDRFAESCFQNGTIFAQATVYGLYFE